MSKYINVDELKRLSNDATAIETKAGLMALVKLIPTIDVVRCKECAHCGRDMDCWTTHRFVTEDGFCDKGERREE